MDNEDEELILEEERWKDKKSKIRFVKKKANQLLLDTDASIPISLNKVVQNLKSKKKLKIFCKPLDLKDKFSGQIIIVGDAVGIIYNKNHSKTRQRFTVAHEIGHLVLEHEFKVKEYKEIINFNSRSPMEREANIFAAELLMPKEKLKSHLLEKNIPTVLQLAKDFDVSEEAMWFKISEDNLLEYFNI